MDVIHESESKILKIYLDDYVSEQNVYEI